MLKKNKASDAEVPPPESAGDDLVDDEDDLAEIDEGNIICGRRTRGVQIDFTKVPDDGADEDDEGDEDVTLGDDSKDLEDDDEDSNDEEEDEGEPEAAAAPEA